MDGDISSSSTSSSGSDDFGLGDLNDLLNGFGF